MIDFTNFYSYHSKLNPSKKRLPYGLDLYTEDIVFDLLTRLFHFYTFPP